MGWLMGKIGRKLKRQSLEAQGKWSETMSQLEETLGGMRVIKAFTAEEKMINRFNKCSNEYRDATSRVSTRQSMAHPMSEFLGTVLIVFVLWFGGSLILGNNSSIDASTFIYYMVIPYSIINPLKDFSKASYMIPRGLASMERVDKILKAPNNIVEKQHPCHISELKSGIDFNHITFSYNGQHQVLNDINLHINKGETIALVGQSGSGKSTLVDLLPRFHDVQGGEILIDGVNIKDLSIMDLRSLIGYVNQEAILFNDSFYNNITFGVDNATKEQVIEAAKIANAHDFIMESEEGYDTNIGDRGCRLSGGQRQRISIARAILKNPAILILDEATSALDTESERLVQGGTGAADENPYYDSHRPPPVDHQERQSDLRALRRKNRGTRQARGIARQKRLLQASERYAGAVTSGGSFLLPHEAQKFYSEESSVFRIELHRLSA